jgi:hypothetical protein
MNTLPRAVTAQVLTDSTLHYRLRQHWRTLMASSRKHQLTAMHHLLYLTLSGKDWRKSFTCISNQRKLDNGAFAGWMMFRAIAAMHIPSREPELLAPFDGLVTPAILEHIRQVVPVRHAYQYRPDQFTATSFPFEAYVVPAALESAEQDASDANA